MATAHSSVTLRCLLYTFYRYVGGRRALFLDEISTGLDSATLFNIVRMLGRITRYAVNLMCEPDLV